MRGRDALVAAVLGASFAATFPVRGGLNRHYDAVRHVRDEAQVPRASVARVASLGHVAWAADVLWLNSMLYYGDALMAHLSARYIRAYADSMLELDPELRDAYLWAAQALSMRSVTVPEADLRVALGYLRRGLDRFPDDPELNFQYAFVSHFELRPRLPPGSPERRRATEDAAPRLARAVALGYGPPWLALTSANILGEVGRHREAVETLRAVLIRVEDEPTRARFEESIAAHTRLRTGDDPETQALNAIERARRAEMPWAPPTLYLFVGSAFITSPTRSPQP